MKERALLILSCLAGIAQSAFYYTRMPEQVATHFGAGGLPNGWMTRTGDFIITAIAFVFVTIAMICTALVARITPIRFVNLPNREYWLEGKRKSQTLSEISARMCGFGVVLNMFFLVMNHLVFRANLANPVLLNEKAALCTLGCFLLFTAGWLLLFIRHFRKPTQ